MMLKVENFRNLFLYKRSLVLTNEVFKWIKSNDDFLYESEEIRKIAVTIPKKIASAIAQVNMKIRFKRLNDAKMKLRKLFEKLIEIKNSFKVDYQSWQQIVDRSIEVMKLLNAYFKWISNKRQRNSNIGIT